ncbi:hypothetical protein DL93DRAFT_2072827 [Clavulina sp. PMI_390]|nr:hypothetical protein DL93DRAFT_2072827 [Clavulina sp. PMI_390]
MMWLVIGGFSMTFGLVGRYPLNNPKFETTTIKLVQSIFTLLSPVAFIASNYALLGRQALHTGTNHMLIIKASVLTTIFILSDIITFIIQLGGAVFTADTKVKNSMQLGTELFKVGMIAQSLSFVFFTFVFIFWLLRVRTQSPRTWDVAKRLTLDGQTRGSYDPYVWSEDWRALAVAQAISCGGIIVRSTYRTITALQGVGGTLNKNQDLFYAFDTLPLLVSIGIYAIWWPGNFIDPQRIAMGGGWQEMEKAPMGMASDSGVGTSAVGMPPAAGGGGGNDYMKYAYGQP